MSTDDTNPPSDFRRRIAAIDIGSNSIRLIIADLLPDGSYELVDDEKAVTRLARGISDSGRMDPVLMDEAARAIARMREIAEGHGATELQAVATAAVREASNQADFLTLVKTVANVDVKVIDGEAEARLAHASVEAAFDLSNDNTAVMDIGGGSTEIVLSASGIVSQVVSVPIGAVRLTEMMDAQGITGPGPRLDAMRRRVRTDVRQVMRRPVLVPEVVYGTGGTFTTIAMIDRFRREPADTDLSQLRINVRGYSLHRADVRRLLENLAAMSASERNSVRGLSSDRSEIIVAGLAIADTVMGLLDANELRVHDRGVRDGLLLEMGRAIFPSAPRRGAPRPDRFAAARRFAQRCNRDTSHSVQVEKLALSMYDQLSGSLRRKDYASLSDTHARDLLQAAAILHDIGYYISYSRHHKHSYHLIVHSDLTGFDSRELELIANIARYHRRAHPRLKHPHFALLDEDERRIVQELSAILRIAVGLDRAHAANVETVEVTITSDDTALFTVDAARRPEADLWGGEKKSRLFRRVFGRTPTFVWAGGAERDGDDGDFDSTLSVSGPADRVRDAHHFRTEHKESGDDA